VGVWVWFKIGCIPTNTHTHTHTHTYTPHHTHTHTLTHTHTRVCVYIYIIRSDGTVCGSWVGDSRCIIGGVKAGGSLVWAQALILKSLCVCVCAYTVCVCACIYIHCCISQCWLHSLDPGTRVSLF